MRKKDICVDFDGTCVVHEFPAIGRDVPGAVQTLKALVDKGHRLILFTMRSDRRKVGGVGGEEIEDVAGDFLTNAVKWFALRDIPLHGIQRHPTQDTWTTSPKAYGNIYIDDAALGCPLYHNPSGRPYVDWERVTDLLKMQGVL
jgi:hypothetical protein